ncbi:PREDICTED: F-box protein At5g07670 isoform X2 [Camelina sativa]|uniref:F-box protein At5g07670 isoform X2 n=1 Tax=Camelina sativa TaxID=90675 RepID=A0ABM0XUZ0_CAMSA|nr:PREDICTED: F-box protein At5g07670 isoform X2 [Camelina sativa]
MSYRGKKENSPVSPLKKRRASWSELWVNHHHLLTSSPLDFAAKFQSLTPPTPISKSKTLLPPDFTLLLPDLILIRIIEKIPKSHRKNLSLVCKRWFKLHGRLVRSLRLSDWGFLASGRLISRFPNLDTVDLVSGCLISPPNSGILVNHRIVSFTVDVGSYQSWSFFEENLLSVEVVDRGLKALAGGCSNLRKLVVTNTSELGLLNVAEECSMLQELELHKCSDSVLLGIGAFENLQILKLVVNVDDLYHSLVSDIGLMILAQGCKRLVKLELVGCEGGFDGIKEIGQCCQMLEELTVCDHKMESGWLEGLRYCENLKTLKLVSCKKIDNDPDECLSCCCPALERLQLEKCQLRDKNTVKALFKICEAAREIVFQDCWGLDDDIFSLATAFGRVKLLYLEGCSLLTTSGLESVILHWHELEHLKVVSCKNIKDSEVSPSLSALFSALVELQWRPDTRSHLSSSLTETGIGGKGGKFFKKT